MKYQSRLSEEDKLPTHWQVKKLGEVCKILSGYGFPKNLQCSKEGKYPFYKVGDISKNVKAGSRQLELCDNYIDEKTLIKLRAKPYPKNTIVFAKIEEGLKLNRRAIIKTPGIVDNNAIGLKAIDNICDDLFLFNFLTTVKLEDYSKATTVPSVRKSEIEQIPFPLPPLPEQQAIVSKIEELLSDLENGKLQLQTAQQQLKVYRQSLLKAAFEGKLTSSIKEAKNEGSKELRNERIKELSQGNHNNHKNHSADNLPEGWKWVKISEICNIVRGGSPRPAGDPKYYDGKIPFLKVRDITKDSNTYLTTFEYTIKEAGLHKTRQIKPNTLLLSNSGATLGVPKICMIDATMNDGIAAFLDLDKRSNLYLYYFWLSKTKELRNINMGAAQPNLNTDIIKNYLLPYCSFEEQQLIVDELESKLTVCDKIEETINQSLQQAETLRQSILKKAFEGKLTSAIKELRNEEIKE